MTPDSMHRASDRFREESSTLVACQPPGKYDLGMGSGRPRKRPSPQGGPPSPRLRTSSGTELDATFHAEFDGHRTSIIYECRGGTKGSANARNSEYLPALELLLSRLQRMRATLDRAFVDSQNTRHLPLEDKSIPIHSHNYPVALASVSDIAEFRVHLTEGERPIGRRKGAKAGNNTRRLRLYVTIPGFDGRPSALEAALASDASSAPLHPTVAWSDLEVQPPPRRASHVCRQSGRVSRSHGRSTEADADLGRRGEEWALDWERQRLTHAGRPDLALRLVHASVHQGDGLGYDIASFDATGQERFIEVKTTTGSIDTHFIISDKEVRTSVRLAGSWYLYRVFDFPRRPRVFVLRGDVSSEFTLRPRDYYAAR